MIGKFFRSPRGWLWLSTIVVLLLETVLFAQSASIRGFATGDGGVKLWQVQGILRTGDLNAPLDYPGAIYDPNHQYAPFVEPWAFWKDGKFYSEYASPFIWASVPLYASLGHVGLMILPWLCGMLLVIMTAWLAWRVRPDRWACLAPLIVGCASPLLIYSLEFWEHTPGAALAVFALVAVVKALDSNRRSWWLIASGAAIGLGLTMRAELYVYPIAIAIGLAVIVALSSFELVRGKYPIAVVINQVFIRSALPLIRSIVWLAIGGLLVAGPWWLYQFITWGSPFGPRLHQNVPVLGGDEMLARLGDTTGRNYVMLWPQEGNAATAVIALLIAAIGLAVGLRVVRRWSGLGSTLGARVFTIGFWLLALNLIGLAALTSWQLTQEFRPNDLLTTFPAVLLLLLPVPSSANRFTQMDNRASQSVRFLGATAAAFVALVLLVSPFQGGVQWGPRFLLPVIVPLAVIVVVHAWKLWHGWQRTGKICVALVLAMLLAAGLYSTWSGVRVFIDARQGTADLAAKISNLPERVVVADAWFIPQGVPYTLSDKLWFMTEDEQSMFQLLQMLRKTTPETSVIYLSSPYWAHIDPLIRMGPRLALIGDPPDTSQYVTLARYQLLR